jgi:small subunit ribosomal protein S1
VTRIADFGVFVNIDGMVEGLMHVSETPLARGQKPQEHYVEGQKVRATILRIEDEEMKVGLSSRDLAAAEAAAVEPAAEAPKKKRSRKKTETDEE